MALPTNIIEGTAQGVGDTLFGSKGDDLMMGQSGDDVMYGGRGDDRMIGGQGNDVMAGGLGADTFVWSAGHIGDGEADYVTDFDINFGDTLQFLDSDGGDFQVLSVQIEGSDATEQNGVDLRNKMTSDNDIVFSVMNTSTGAMQDIVLLDVWSSSKNAAWEEMLADMGLTFGDNTLEEVACEYEVDTVVSEECYDELILT